MQSEGVEPNAKLFNGLIELSGFEEKRRKSSGDSSEKGEEEFKAKLTSILAWMRQAGMQPTTTTLNRYSKPIRKKMSHQRSMAHTCMQHIVGMQGGWHGAVGAVHLPRAVG